MTDLADRLEEIITTLTELDITTAIAGIHRSLPGWPSGGRGGTPDIDPDTGEPMPALTKVEAVALTPDAAKAALIAYPRICAAVLRASEAVSALRTSGAVTDPARAVLMSSVMLREAQRRSQRLDHRTLQPLWNQTMSLRNETLRWVAIIRPVTGKPIEGTGIVSTDPKWCSSCARIPHTNEPRDGHHTRCRWCHSFHATYGQDPPTKLLERHLRGERIYQHQIDQAIARHPAKRISA